MKKICLFVLIFIFLINFQFIFAQEKNEKEFLNANITYTHEKKDTNLISMQKTKPVNDAKYAEKIKNDKTTYQKYKNELKEEYYDLTVILDKLLRANNLQYQNWRIGLDIQTEDINAYATSANLIIINSSIYDSLYQNKDALAFIIAHELSHLILGHIQISYENSIKILNLEQQVLSARNEAEKQNTLSILNNAVGNYNSAMGNSVSSLAYNVSVATMNSTINRIYAQERKLELIADSEAIVLMTRAGYNPANSKEVLELLSNLPNIYTNRSTHPDSITRKKNIDEALFINDIEELENQGKRRLFESSVLTIKKSSDKKTVILSKASNNQKYTPITREEKLIKKAYSYYLNNDYEMAKELFGKAYLENKENFIPALYLSYINEYDFKQNQQKKSLKNAQKWIKRAVKISSENKFVKKQNSDIKDIIINLRKAKKSLNTENN